mgnify:CR=1 FL=1
MGILKVSFAKTMGKESKSSRSSQSMLGGWKCIGENRDAYVRENAIMSKTQRANGAKLLPLYFMSHSLGVGVLVGEGEIERGGFSREGEQQD